MLYVDELTDSGYEVITRSNGTGLMEIIEQEKPDLIVLDITLDKYKGLNVFHSIREVYKNLPVILCTDFPDFKYEQETIDNDPYVVKSLDLQELKLKIKMFLEYNNMFKSQQAVQIVNCM